MARFTLGVDFGRERDFSAAVLIEHILRRPPPEPDAVTMARRQGKAPERDLEPEEHVRGLWRWPLKTDYHRIVADLGDIMGSAAIREDTLMAYDRTGVGNAVREMLNRAYLADKLGPRYPNPITITAGIKRSGLSVPKRDLISALEVRLEKTGRFRYPDKPDDPNVQQFRHELSRFERTLRESGHDAYEAATEKDHDDFVIATCLAVWLRNRRGEPRVLDFDGIGAERWE